MKITFSKEEVIQLILDYANAMTPEHVEFNVAASDNYMSIPAVTVSYEAPVQMEIYNAAQ